MMRITDLPLISEVKDGYVKLRQNGSSRADAMDALIRMYDDEIHVGAEDDGPQFWVGLADGQYTCKELCRDVAERATRALDQLLKIEPDITKGDILRRKERYARAPMPERNVRKRTPFRCTWKLGDTYAHTLTGPEAEALGIAGNRFLFRKVDAYEFGDGRLLPVVTVSMWEKQMLPATEEEFRSVPMLKIRSGKRTGFLGSKFEYRAEMIIQSKKQLESLQLEYVGNFQDVVMPDDEIIFTDPGQIEMIIPKLLDQTCCIYWKMHLYCTGMGG